MFFRQVYTKRRKKGRTIGSNMYLSEIFWLFLCSVANFFFFFFFWSFVYLNLGLVFGFFSSPFLFESVFLFFGPNPENLCIFWLEFQLALGRRVNKSKIQIASWPTLAYDWQPIRDVLQEKMPKKKAKSSNDVQYLIELCWE